MSARGSLTVLQRTQVRLDQLPAGSVVLDRHGHAWQSVGAGWAGAGRDSAYWYRAYGDDSQVTSRDLAQAGPCVLMSPAATTLDRARTKKTR